ncbi:MAG TPA: maleylpyruvate isomerase family mycothiol-dependent enzyme [Pseudonocardiaceae bacterium]|jgi:uncharacterized protein (TIGR03083 family)|nr:maleylpyruvate isomerase family mycothiol-dependent enzyme [Pseudonocardiaceae bacterium]
MTSVEPIDADRLIERLRVEAETLAATVDAADPSALAAPVPGAPGLTMGEVTRHVGSIYRMTWHWIREGGRPADWRRDPAAHQTLTGYVRAGATALLAELNGHEPDEPCATWLPSDQTYRFWRRRMAHESTVHRIDVQNAAGAPISDIPQDIAVDGIDEALHLWFTHRLAVLGVTGTRRGLVAVRAAGYQWLAHAGPHGTSVDRLEPGRSAEPDAVVSGSATQVYLWLWGRVSDRQVRHSGNQDAIAQLWALLRLGMR